jgi:hypothetical protein
VQHKVAQQMPLPRIPHAEDKLGLWDFGQIEFQLAFVKSATQNLDADSKQAFDTHLEQL